MPMTADEFENYFFCLLCEIRVYRGCIEEGDTDYLIDLEECILEDCPLLRPQWFHETYPRIFQGREIILYTSHFVIPNRDGEPVISKQKEIALYVTLLAMAEHYCFWMSMADPARLNVTTFWLRPYGTWENYATHRMDHVGKDKLAVAIDFLLGNEIVPSDVNFEHGVALSCEQRVLQELMRQSQSPAIKGGHLPKAD